MKNFLLLLFFTLSVSTVYGQAPPDLPINFDDPAIDYNLVSFGANVSGVLGADPTDASNTALCITKDPNPDCWGGTTVGGACLANPVPFAPGSMTIYVDVYSPDAGVPFLLKVENCANGALSSEVIVLTTVANAWETLAFDFSAGCPAVPDPAIAYSRLSVFPIFTCAQDLCGAPNPGVGAPTSTEAYYFDNITMIPPPPSPPSLPISFGEANTIYNLVPFGANVSAVIGADPTDATNEALCVTKDPNPDCWGGVTIGDNCLDAPIPFAPGNMTINADIYSPDAGVPFLIKVEECGNPGNSSEVIVLSTMANAWETLSFDFSTGCPVPPNLASSYSVISVFPIFTCATDLCGNPNPGAGAPTSTDAYYFDNITLVPTVSDLVPITFCADLNCLPNGDAAAVAGSFNGGNPGADFLTDPDGDGVFCTTIDLSPGVETFRFFTAVGQFEDLSALEGEACVTGTAPNVMREITIEAGVPQTVTFGWESCDASCAVTPTADITFCADLSCLPNGDAAAVAGSFNGGSPGANFLTDPDGDGFFCTTVAVPEGVHTYRFFTAVEQFEDLSALEGQACVTGTAPNVMREITVVADVPQTVTFGWESCDAMCPPGPDLPITFDDPGVNYSLVPFGAGVSTSVGVDPTDPTNAVVCTFKSPTADCWGGVTVGADCLENPVPFGPGNMVMTVDVFSPNAGVPFLLKVEDCDNAAISSEVIALTTVANAWETLVFDFATGCAGPPNLAISYSRLSVFPIFTCDPDLCGEPNPGANAPTSTEAYYFDNIMMCALPFAGITCPANLTAACEIPAAATDEASFIAQGGTIDNPCNSVPLTVTSVDVADATGITTTRTYMVSDGITTFTCNQTITLVPISAITCPPNSGLSCSDAAPAAATDEASFIAQGGTIDNTCGSAVTVSSVDVTTGDICGTVITRTYTISDGLVELTCNQVITLDDTTPPVVTCPANLNLDCLSGPIPVANTVGEFLALGGTISDDCTTDFTIEFGDSPGSPDQLNLCSPNAAERTVTRVYTITDACGNPSSCTQTFTFSQSLVGPTITEIPTDKTISCAVEALPELANFNADADCGLELTKTVVMSSPTGTPNCPGSQIRFTYTAEDGCGRMATHVQTYTIQNDAFELICPSIDCQIDCGASPDEAIAAFDAYTGNAIFVTSCNNLDPVVSYNFNPASLSGCGSQTTVNFTATDPCGRSASCASTVVVVDNTAPIITGQIPDAFRNCGSFANSDYQNWAQGAMQSVDIENNCDNTITWSFSPNSPNMENCGNGGISTTNVTFTATDNCGNATQTTGKFHLKVAPIAGEMMTVSGHLRTESNELVELVDLNVTGSGLDEAINTTIDGYYEFELPIENNYVITPNRNDNPLNGISTMDLIMISRHVLGIETLDSPYRLIAADVNNNGEITAFDMVELRRLLLMIDSEFANNTSWRFVAADYIFADPTNPFASTFPSSQNINDLVTDMVGDFIGIKTGDVNGSAIPNQLAAQGDSREGLDDLVFQVDNKKLTAGEQYTVDFKAKDFVNVLGYQFTLQFDPNQLDFVDFEKGELSNLNASNFGIHLREGVITSSWNAQKAANVSDDAVLFSLTFEAKTSVNLSKAISLNSNFTISEAYSQNESLLNLALDFKEGNTLAENASFELFQNQPNPFKSTTLIGFTLAEAAQANLTIYDVAGRVLKTVEGDFVIGYNEINLDRSELQSSGVLYYQLSTGTQTATKKMILLK